MELGKERVEDVYCFPLDLDEDEAKRLRDIGLEQIANDEEALINYAVNFILAQQIEQLEETNSKLMERIKEKNGESKS
jgi:hypothetical protein